MAKKILRRILVLLGLALLCPQAPGRAQNRFSFPYDPDFGAERPQPQEPAAPAPGTEDEEPLEEETPVELPEWVRSAGPFLLLDRSDPEHFFETPAATAPARDFSEFLRDFEPVRYDQARWNKMRDDYERGTLPGEELVIPEISPELPGLPEPPAGVAKPAPPELELPTYGTSLSITGRKVIGFSFNERRYLRDQRTTGRQKSVNLVDITQQLQLRMQGKVGPKITVNVDYDDTKTNKQDISIVYQGDPNEVVQNASFGDIDLSLPATEFVSYNKQLFGIRVNLQYKGFKAIFIGSRTKGQTKTKQFKGNSQFTTVDILDTSYVRRRYYDLTFGNAARLPIAFGSERVFLSKPSNLPANTNDITGFVADDLGNSAASSSGTFTQLAPGIDYTVDYVKGILTFKNSIDPALIAAVDFVDASAVPLRLQTSVSTGTSGGTNNPKIIKTFGDVPIISSTTEAGFNRELKTFYSIGRSQIIRDNGRGNFIFNVLDQARNVVGPSLNPPQTYPETIDVDFENGTFQLEQPFGISASSPQPDPEIYAPAPLTKRLFHIEFQFRLKTFFLEPNLVLQSEVVLVDNVRLQRNVDYFIDYESGFLTFFNDDRIRQDSVVDVSYEVAPFAGNATESLLGTRVSYDLNRHWSIGSTLLYQSGSKPPSVPTINELAKSLIVYEADSQLKDLRLTSWLTGTFQGEIAQSVANPNLSKRAIVENMEGIKQDDSASTLDISWQAAANPNGNSADPNGFSFFTEDVRTLDINPTAPASPQDSQKVLNLTYDFGVSASSEVSIVHAFSPTGLDFSQKNILEVTMWQSSATNNSINFHLGGIAEDADGDGVFDTEDLPPRDNLLQPAEDTGFTYNPPGKNTKFYGATNGRIDSEDLNQNGRIDPPDFSGDDFGYAGGNPNLFDVTSGSTRTSLDFTGWHTFQIPLNISSATLANWVAIKQVRITIGQGGGSGSGAVRFARVAVVGNTWQRGQPGDPAVGATVSGNASLSVNAVNNVDNPGYIPIFRAGGAAQQVFNDLYGDTGQLQRQSNTNNLQEQALQLRYASLTNGTTVYTRRVFARSIDVSQHKKFSFLLFRDGGSSVSGDKVFFLRAGADKDFFEVRIPLTFVGWRKITIDQKDRTGDQIPDSWAISEGSPGAVVISSGAPNLQQIGSITAGVFSTSDTNADGTVLLNEIHVDEPLKRKGVAQKLQMDLTVAGWGSFGARYRFVDRNYQTPTTVVTNQDNRQDSAYLNFDRIRFFPMRFNLSRTITVTPNTNATGNLSNTVNLLQQGKVTTWNGNANGNFALGTLPRLTLGYDRNRIEYDLLTRLDDRKTYNGGLSYGVPLNSRFLPKTVDLNYQHIDSRVTFESLQSRLLPGNANTFEFTDTYGARMSFVPWGGSTFNPNYSITKVKEDRVTLTGAGEARLSYPKAMNQSTGFAANFRLLRWLNPAVNYNVTTIENNILNISTFIVSGSTFVFNVGDIKTINRSANGNLSVTLAMGEILPRSKLLRSMNFTNGYQLQDGDVTNNVERTFDSKAALWIRTPLRVSNPAAQRVNQTLRDTYNSSQRWSPLEAYDIRGRAAAFKTLSLSNNFVKSIQRTETTGTPSKTISTTLPDLLASMSQLEQILYTSRWMRNTQVNLRYSLRDTLNVGISDDKESSFGSDLRSMIRERFDTSLSFNLRSSSKEDLRVGQVTQTTNHKDATAQTTFDLSKFRFTPKVDYTNDVTKLGNGTRTQDLTVLTPTLLIRSDLAIPRGLYMPFTKRTLLITNRIIWTTTLSYAMRSSPVTISENSRLFNFNTSADYEIAKNLRMTLNGSMQRLWHRFLKEEEYVAYQFGTTLTFQF